MLEISWDYLKCWSLIVAPNMEEVYDVLCWYQVKQWCVSSVLEDPLRPHKEYWNLWGVIWVKSGLCRLVGHDKAKRTLTISAWGPDLLCREFRGQSYLAVASRWYHKLVNSLKWLALQTWYGRHWGVMIGSILFSRPVPALPACPLDYGKPPS